MILKRLDWDSTFFNLNVFLVQDEQCEMFNFAEIEHELKILNANLVYLFLKDNSPNFDVFSNYNNCILLDRKITLIKKLSNLHIEDSSIEEISNLNSELLELAFLSGKDSRFKKDNKLTIFFEPLYQKWIQNSLSGSLASKVLVYKFNGSIIGFITIMIKNNSGQIGLIAVNPLFQGKGIGRKLINAIENYLIDNAVHELIVVTQKDNNQALDFYLSLDFKIIKEESVFHWWL